MLDISYEQHPGNACALACYTMTARHFFSDSTFKQIGKISDWTPGYVVWAFNFWLWIMDKGIKVEDYDLIDYELWISKGFKALKETMNDDEYVFYLTKNKI